MLVPRYQKKNFSGYWISYNINAFFLLGKKFVSSVRPIGLGGYIRNGVNVAEKL